MKQNAIEYKPKKARIFEKEAIDKFLLEAPDEKFLMKKVYIFIFIIIDYFLIFFQIVAIFGIADAC